MEIKLQGTAIPCVAEEDIVAGLAVKLVPATAGAFTSGASPDVTAGAQLPTGDDDIDAKFVSMFRVYNEKTPLYEGLTTLDETGNTSGQAYVLREFVEGDSNLPEDVTLRMTTPRLQEGQTILSGALMLAYDDGIYTVTSGCFTHSANLIVGNYVTANTGGIWAYTATAADRVGRVFEYDQTNAKLTIKTGI